MKDPIDINSLKEQDFATMLELTGCIKKGHTEHYNGQHSNGWIDISGVMKFPALLNQFTFKQAELIRKMLPQVDLIISPAVSGAIVGNQVAKHLDVEFAVTLEKGEDIKFHRRYNPSRVQPVCLVEDVIFTGADVEANINFLRKVGFSEIYCCCWFNYREAEIMGVKVFTLIDSIFERYDTKDCPLCKAGLALEYTGIRE